MEAKGWNIPNKHDMKCLRDGEVVGSTKWLVTELFKAELADTGANSSLRHVNLAPLCGQKCLLELLPLAELQELVVEDGSLTLINGVTVHVLGVNRALRDTYSVLVALSFMLLNDITSSAHL